MNTIDFQCPNCSRSTKIPKSLEGQSGTCPGCKQIVMVVSTTIAPPLNATRLSRLTSCPDCDAQVSTSATACPKCGCPIAAKAQSNVVNAQSNRVCKHCSSNNVGKSRGMQGIAEVSAFLVLFMLGMIPGIVYYIYIESVPYCSGCGRRT